MLRKLLSDYEKNDVPTIKKKTTCFFMTVMCSGQLYYQASNVLKTSAFVTVKTVITKVDVTPSVL